MRLLAVLIALFAPTFFAASVAGDPSGVAQAESSLVARVQAQIALEEEVSGSFQQKKFIAVLPQPLHSSGRFHYQRNAGLLWETVEPIASRLVFDDRGIRQSVDGETVWEVDAQQPAAVTITRVISSVLAADWDTLRQYFSIEGAVEQGHWQLELSPKDEVLSQVVSAIIINGDSALRVMMLKEANGDRTEISFQVSEQGGAGPQP